MELQAEIIRLKTEFEEIIRMKNGLIFQLVERGEKAETALEELREAVAWYFETRSVPLFKRIPSKKFRELLSWEDALSEFNGISKHAEQRLRLAGGEDET